MKRAPSHVSQNPAELAFQEESEVDTELRDLLYDEKSGNLACSSYEALLLQLPGTLPFADVKPHTATALEDMIERLSLTSLEKEPPAADVEMQSDQNDG